MNSKSQKTPNWQWEELSREQKRKVAHRLAYELWGFIMLGFIMAVVVLKVLALVF